MPPAERRSGAQTGDFSNGASGEITLGIHIATVTAEAGYAYGKILGGLEDRNIAAVIPTKAEPIRSPVPLRRFRYDAKHDILKCPRGEVLRPGKPVKHGRFFHSRWRDCSRCDLKALCISKGRMTKSVVIGDHHPAWLARAPSARPVDRGGGRPPLPAPPVAIRGLPWRGEDPARSGASGQARPAETAHPGLPHSGGGEPRAARRGRARPVALGARRHRQRDPNANRAAACVACSRPSLTAIGFFNGSRLHFMRNALAHAGRSGRRVVSAFMATAFAEDDAEAARRQWRRVADQFRPKLLKLAALMDQAEADVLAYMGFPAQRRAKLLSTNPLERLDGEVKRRTEAVGIFPNEAAIRRLVGAILLDQNDEWAVRRARYITLESVASVSDDAVVSLVHVEG